MKKEKDNKKSEKKSAQRTDDNILTQIQDMELDERLVRFDWAIKRLLRHKADHTILNGFLTSLLERPIRILKMLESEGNRENEENKSNRVDLLAEEADGSKIIIEVQNETEDSYFHRILFGTSKVVAEYIKKNQKYDHIVKVYSINIVYFDLGEGDDYVYHGYTEFRGIHNNRLLELPKILQNKFGVKTISGIFPEYYILKTNDFNKWSRTPLDQWMHFLAHSNIPRDADAPGLREAYEELKISTLSPQEKREYERYLDDMESLKNVAVDSYGRGLFEGEEKGRAEGLEQGREQEKWLMAENMMKDGLPIEKIAQYSGLPIPDLKSRFNIN